MTAAQSKTGKEMIATRYVTNPFLENMVIPMKGRRVQLSRLGRENHVLLNQQTGEHYGTHVTTTKRVDSEQFVKLFTANITMTFDLTSPGIKAFSVLIWAVQSKALAKDEVDLDAQTLKEFIDANEKVNKKSMSLPTFRRGVSELEKAQIVARTVRLGRYFINPNFVFNGDRIAFTTIIERRSQGQQLELDV